MLRKFQEGEPAPLFICKSLDNPKYHFDTVAGRYIILFFFNSSTNEVANKILTAIHHQVSPYLDDHKFSFFGVSRDASDEKNGRLKQRIPGIRYFIDDDLQVSYLYGAVSSTEPTNKNEHRSFTLILDPFLRVMGEISADNPVQHIEMLLEVILNLPEIDLHAGAPLHAPVLILPRVFEPSFCRHLIELYKLGGGRESGFMREENGLTVEVHDNQVKRRKDVNLEEYADYNNVCAAIRHKLLLKLVPQIYKVFQFNASHIERYIISCYEAENRGFFRPHRDNTTRGTMHRKFAVTINLNAEEYEGGNLRFPEFGTRTYRAPTGGAVVFSCSLLHEATPVLKGKRYAFLPFLYDAPSAVIREENKKYLRLNGD